MSVDKLKELKHNRGLLKAQVTRFISFVDSFSVSNKSVKELEKRLQKIEPLYESFDTIQAQIELLDLDKSNEVQSITQSDQERDTFESTFFDITSRAQEIIDDTNKNSMQNASSAQATPVTQIASSNFNIKLPPIKIPAFSGSYSEFMQFQNTFTSLIHENDLLSKIQKFYYLKSYLQGDALKIVQSLDITDENYDIAWNLLKKRYQNKRVIINSHLKSIFELPTLSRENSTALRNFVDTLEKDVKSLKNLGEPVDQWSSILIYLCVAKLDFSCKREWENSIKDTTDMPTLENFINFLNSRCQFLETLFVNRLNANPEKGHKHNNTQFSHFSGTNKLKCFFCKENHCIFFCKRFLDMTPQSRTREIKKLNMCSNCLRPNHTSNCTGQCKKCGKSHNTLLHIDNISPSSNNQNNTNRRVQYKPVQGPVYKSNDQNDSVSDDQAVQMISEGLDNSSISAHCSQTSVSNTVLLGTAMIYVKDYTNTLVACRALLDGASQSNFMSKQLVEKIGLSTKRVEQSIIGVGETSTRINRSVNTVIRSIHNTFSKDVSFLILDKITGSIPQSYQAVAISQLKIPEHVPLADPEYYISKPIDILLGASVFYELLLNGNTQIKLGRNMPILTKTKLGYILAGPLQVHKQSDSYTSCFLSVNNDNTQIQSSLEKFWEIEHVQECKPKILTKEEQFCESHFLQTHSRDHTGRFEVMLPLKANYLQLNDNFETAKKRLFTIERKMQRDEDFSSLYKNFMKEYELLGHMSKLNSDQVHSREIKQYLPHHGVFKVTSETTKLRVVFDASSKEQGNISLNDALCVGPVVQEDLFSILVRFRKHTFVMKADITKMYRQVNVHPAHRNLQRILWRENPNQDISHFVLNTVTYGTGSASFLAIRSLQQAAIENIHKYPEACKVILSDFYVDDVISGADTSERLQELKSQISLILSSAGFVLSQWMFNKNSNVQQQNVHFSDSGDSSVRTLGILWNPNKDTFQYVANLKYYSQSLTKRAVLSIISQIFDPLGLVGPVLIKAKILLQQLWKLNLDWDDPIPENFQGSFVQFCQDLPNLCQVSIARHATLSTYITIELHGFTDASMSAYGVCIFLKTTDSSGNSYCQLLCSKSRISPIKVISLPRLELCGAVLLTRLVVKCIEALKITIVQSHIYLWTDSEIVLAWLSREPSTWKIFVSNRVSEIQRASDVQSWRHVDSADNPADVISRGCSLSFLINCELWWSGPKWLRHDPQSWPVKSKLYTNLENVPEKGTHNLSCHIMTANAENFNLFTRFSSLTKLVNVTAYCLRFITNCKSQKSKRKLESLSIQEVDDATLTLVKLVQKSQFAQEIQDIKTKGQVASNSKTLSLSPFIENDILHVGGRLRNSDLQFEQKCPMLLPSKHPFTDLIIRHEHEKTLHGGVQTVLAAVRCRYWPINAKNNIKRIIRACVLCFRVKPKSIKPLMGQLPLSRVNVSRPFLSVGIDFAGPVLVKDGSLKTRKVVKTYICVFVCFCTKAIHLELVGDLSADAFLCALKRFISRRGIIRDIHSDNGSNFVKANKYLKEIYKKVNIIYNDPSVRNYLMQNRVTWHFIPPRSPSFGGLWESAVKVMKYHLIRIIGDQRLTYENLYTILCQIESVMNSRPICPISSDPNDPITLTPGHFLIGAQMNSIPEEDISAVPQNRLTKYQQVQQISLHFWRRWSREYLHNLQQKTKWMFKDPQVVKCGLMVILHDNQLPPLQWKTGRIVETHPGKDGEVRVVSVQTSHGIFKRAVTKISVLPIEH